MMPPLQKRFRALPKEVAKLHEFVEVQSEHELCKEGCVYNPESLNLGGLDRPESYMHLNKTKRKLIESITSQAIESDQERIAA